ACSCYAMADGDKFVAVGGVGAARAVSLEPGSALAASEGSVTASGSLGEEGEAAWAPEPEAAAPPVLILTSGVPEIEMPAGPMSIKLAPALSESCMPASITTTMPPLTWTFMPAWRAAFWLDLTSALPVAVR